MSLTKAIFTTVEQAKDALAMDALGTIYWKAGQVFIVTAYGSGTFSAAAWGDKPVMRPGLGR